MDDDIDKGNNWYLPKGIGEVEIYEQENFDLMTRTFDCYIVDPFNKEVHQAWIKIDLCDEIDYHFLPAVTKYFVIAREKLMMVVWE